MADKLLSELTAVTTLAAGDLAYAEIVASSVGRKLTISNFGAETLRLATRQHVVSSHAKIGATSGWAVNAADNIGYLATCPASQTASTLVVPVSGLLVGDKITAFSVVGQIESGGNTVTLDADLRKHTAAAADPSDASVGSITQISVTADTIISSSKTGLSDTVGADETFYVLLTATTGASTDIALMGITITVGA